MLKVWNYKFFCKILEVYKTRILVKITALILEQHINKFIFDKPTTDKKNSI